MFTTTAAQTPKAFKKVCFYLLKRQDQSIRNLMQKTGGEYAGVFRYLLDQALKENPLDKIQVVERIVFKKVFVDRVVIKEIIVEKVIEKVQIKEIFVSPALSKEIERPTDVGKLNHCQRCGKQQSFKRLHRYQINFDTFLFCEDCFITGNHKALLRQIL